MNNQEVYDDAEVTQGVSPLVSMSRGDLRNAILCGVGVGVVVGVLYVLLDTFVFGSVLCRPQSASDCSQAPQYAMIVATVFGAIAGLVTAARLRLYRPLFIVLLATVSLWGAQELVAPYPWYWGIVILAALYGAAYGLFAWIGRMRSFIFAIIIGALLLVLVRLVATS